MSDDRLPTVGQEKGHTRPQKLNGEDVTRSREDQRVDGIEIADFRRAVSVVKCVMDGYSRDRSTMGKRKVCIRQPVPHLGAFARSTFRRR